MAQTFLAMAAALSFTLHGQSESEPHPNLYNCNKVKADQKVWHGLKSTWPKPQP